MAGIPHTSVKQLGCKQFAQRTESDPEDKLFDALDGNKPFRRFKDTLYALDIWEEWNKFEKKLAEEEIQTWMNRYELDYIELNEKHKNNHPFRN